MSIYEIQEILLKQTPLYVNKELSYYPFGHEFPKVYKP
jgi:hypothetical protein